MINSFDSKNFRRIGGTSSDRQPFAMGISRPRALYTAIGGETSLDLTTLSPSISYSPGKASLEVKSTAGMMIAGNDLMPGIQMLATTTRIKWYFPYKVPKRATPNVALLGTVGTDWVVRDNDTTIVNPTSPTILIETRVDYMVGIIIVSSTAVWTAGKSLYQLGTANSYTTPPSITISTEL